MIPTRQGFRTGLMNLMAGQGELFARRSFDPREEFFLVNRALDDLLSWANGTGI